MPSSALTLAQRSLVSVLLSVASAYNVAVQVNRDSLPEELLKAYRSVVKKAHPDKGGSTQKFQRLQAAKEAWDAARKKPPPAGGRPASKARAKALAASGLVVSTLWADKGKGCKEGVRVRSAAVLLTYFGKWSLALWRRRGDGA